VLEEQPERNRDAHQRNFIRAAWVDRERAVTITGRLAYVLPRGRDPELIEVEDGGAGTRFDPRRTYDVGSFLLSDMVVDRTPGRLPRMLIAAAAGELVSIGYLFELELDGTSMRLVKTTTVADPLHVVAVDEAGNVAIGAGYGDIYVRRAGEDEFEYHSFVPVDPQAEVLLRRLIWTGDPGFPLAATAIGTINLYDVAAGTWRSQDILTRIVDPGNLVGGGDQYVELVAIAAFHDGGVTELWAGGRRGALFRWRSGDSEWELISVQPPPSFDTCSVPSGTYPDTRIYLPIDDMQEAGDRLYFTIRECSAIVEVRRSDLCTALVGTNALPAPRQSRDLQAIDMIDGELLIAGEKSEMYVRPNP
jgi:hypothetical protein